MISKAKEIEKNDDFKKVAEGHLVRMGCGHRGQPNRIEEKRISRLLRKSGFIPMLEDLPFPTQQPIQDIVPDFPVLRGQNELIENGDDSDEQLIEVQDFDGGMPKSESHSKSVVTQYKDDEKLYMSHPFPDLHQSGDAMFFSLVPESKMRDASNVDTAQDSSYLDQIRRQSDASYRKTSSEFK